MSNWWSIRGLLGMGGLIAVGLGVWGAHVQQGATAPASPAGTISEFPPSAYYQLYRLRLPDGTRCLITYTGGGPTGISCQWKDD